MQPIASIVDSASAAHALDARRRAYRRLLAAIATFLVTHALGMLSMPLLVLPGINPHLSIDSRMRYLIEHPGWWRLGWLPWQLSALADVFVAFALIRWTRATDARRALAWARAAAVMLLLAFVPDQYAEARLIGDFTRETDAAAWLEQLSLHTWLSGTWACIGYTLMSLCWIKASHNLLPEQQVSVRARVLEGSVLVAFFGAAIANHVAWQTSAGLSTTLAFDLTVAFNGYGFVGLLAIGVAIALRVTTRAQAARGTPSERLRSTPY